MILRGLILRCSLAKKFAKKKMGFIIADLIRNNVKKFEFIDKLQNYFNKGRY